MKTLQHRFVKIIPEPTEEGYLYISLDYRTAIHRCACGCGREIITPLAPKSWRLEFDGEAVSLYPSIGNWQLPCRSHYFIIRNKVEWVKERTKTKGMIGKLKSQFFKRNYH
jgi:Family of unknown function (DUF6527)